MIADLIKSIFQWSVALGTRFLLSLFTDFLVEGKEHLRNLATPLFVVGNHRSFWDVPLIGVLLPNFSQRYYPVGFMTRDIFFRNPFIRLLMWLGGGVRAHKGEGLEISLRSPRKILAKKKVFVIFPFGRIVWNGNYPIPGRGAATLIQTTPALSILPIYLDTTPNMTFRMFLFSRCRMRVFVGAPFSISHAESKSTDEITRDLIERIFALSRGIESTPRLADNVNR